jgi:hypothetical protein
MGAAMAGGILTSLSLETIVLRAQSFSWSQAFRTAMTMSFMSMLAMELTESAVAMHLMNGAPFDPTNAVHWACLGPSMAAGFAVPLPYNYFQLKRFGRACH